MLNFFSVMAPWRDSEYTWVFECCSLRSASGDLVSNPSWHKNSNAELMHKPKGSGGAQHPEMGCNMHWNSWQIIWHEWHVLRGC